MNKDKTSISGAKTYKQIGQFWDSHDLSHFWPKTHKAKFQVKIGSEVTYYGLDKSLSDEVQTVAQKRGLSPHALLSTWVREKLLEQRQRKNQLRTTEQRRRKPAT